MFDKVRSLIFIRILLVGAELFHADGQTDMTKLTVAFRNFANAPKKATSFGLLFITQPCVYTHDKSAFLKVWDLMAFTNVKFLPAALTVRKALWFLDDNKPKLVTFSCN